MKEMPFDSSKVKFQDQLDMFFRLKDGYRPEGTNNKAARPKTCGDRQSGQGKAGRGVDTMNAYEQRKQE
jgi:hypothetical protein